MSNGKGSSRRPRQVSRSQYDANWDAVFGPKKQLEYDEEALDRFLVKCIINDQQQLPLPLKERK